MPDQTRINGTMHGWSSVVAKLDGDRFFGFKSIAYGDSRERGKGYGMGRHYSPRGRTAGKYTPEPVAVTMEKETARALRAALAQKASDGKSFGNVVFQIVVQYVEPDGTSITDELEDCVWVKTSAKSEESPDPLYEDVEFDCMRIRWNGTTLYDGTQA